MNVRRIAIAVLGAAIVVLVGIAVLAYAFEMRHRKLDDSEGQLVELDAEAPVAADIELPLARYAEEVRLPHARVELGGKELRLFGENVGRMPAAGGTALAPAELATIRERCAAVVGRDGLSSRTLELAADREVRFGLVADAVIALSGAGFSAKLFLVKDAAGSLRILKPRGGLPKVRVVVDAHGAHSEPTPDAGPRAACDWTSGTPTQSFVDCLVGEQDAGAPDAASRLQRLTILQMLGGGGLVELKPTADARYGDVLAIADALVGEGSSFALSFERTKP